MDRAKFFRLPSVVPDDYTYLLLHAEGGEGGTIFKDYSKYNRAISFTGDVKTTLAQKKFGTSSLLFDGNGDCLYGAYPSDYAFGTGTFTVDFWLRPMAFGDGAGVFDTQALNGLGQRANSFVLALMPDGKIGFYTNGAFLITSTNALTVNTWGHVALTRNSSNIATVYVNGTVGGSVTTSINFSTPNLVVGRYADTAAGFYNGYYDELRVSKGIARWTAAFTPPTEPHAIYR